jgi:hypothetical protein
MDTSQPTNPAPQTKTSSPSGISPSSTLRGSKIFPSSVPLIPGTKVEAPVATNTLSYPPSFNVFTLASVFILISTLLFFTSFTI